MFDNLDIWYDKKFCIAWQKFSINDVGLVLNQEWKNLGYIEDCLEEWHVLMQIMNLFSDMDSIDPKP